MQRYFKHFSESASEGNRPIPVNRPRVSSFRNIYDHGAFQIVSKVPVSREKLHIRRRMGDNESAHPFTMGLGIPSIPADGFNLVIASNTSSPERLTRDKKF